jgi:NAD(P)-dependent dehydrogenase (short-subunit alcohol dehydrogenase family)
VDYLKRKVALVIGGGGDMHRGVAVALAQAGADIAVCGTAEDLAAEAALHSIANEVWALGHRSCVIVMREGTAAAAFAHAVQRAQADLGRADVVVHADPVLNA